MLNGIVGKVTKHAEILAIVASVYSRSLEGDATLQSIAENAAYEVVQTFRDTANINKVI